LDALDSRIKSEYNPLMPIPTEQTLTPLEQACLEFIRDVRRLGTMDPTSPAGLALYHRIKERQAELPLLLAPQRISLDASADRSAPIHKPPSRPVHQPPSRSMKWRGETAQAKFTGKAMAMNLAVAILLSDCLPFDNIVVTPKQMYRVQVKSSAQISWSSWKVSLHRGEQIAYKDDDFDVLAAVTPEEVWYLIPHKIIVGRRTLSLPRRKKIKDSGNLLTDLAPYREAWHVFE